MIVFGIMSMGLASMVPGLLKKGKKLIEALDEMAKYDYEYEDFFEANLVPGDTEGENDDH